VQPNAYARDPANIDAVMALTARYVDLNPLRRA
jgi:hypothetical protein